MPLEGMCPFITLFTSIAVGNIWEYYVKYCQSHITLLWIWILMLCQLFYRVPFDLYWFTLKDSWSCMSKWYLGKKQREKKKKKKKKSSYRACVHHGRIFITNNLLKALALEYSLRGYCLSLSRWTQNISYDTQRSSRLSFWCKGESIK